MSIRDSLFLMCILYDTFCFLFCAKKLDYLKIPGIPGWWLHINKHVPILGGAILQNNPLHANKYSSFPCFPDNSLNPLLAT